ncbi:MAG TPA: MmgE/PrpD family protein [Conexibacter sp.]|jgi:2-methylcitrate dehydratase PrpD
MATVAEQLAARALAPLSQADADALRALTLTNIAAGVGERGALADLLPALPLDARRPADAAYLFAAQLHARTQDDFHPEGRVHVGAIVLAAVLALAEEDTGQGRGLPALAGDADAHKRTLPELARLTRGEEADAHARTLPALAAGYRVLCTVARSYSVQAQRRGLRPSGVFGPFGAAAAAAVMLGLDPTQTANAIALSAAACGGHNQAWIASSDEWFCEVGAAARAGVEAALFTRAGVRAAPDAIEGKAGWAAALFDEPGAAGLTETLAEHSEEQERELSPQAVAVKPYPVSGIAQVPTGLACALHDDAAGDPIADVRVSVSPIEHAYPGSGNRGPFASRASALMSIAFCVACGLADGTVRLARLERPGAPDLAELLSRVSVVPDPALPENEARVALRTAGGRELSRSGRAADVLFPPWARISADGEELARRSEAAAESVARARDALSAPAPSATELRRLLEVGT